MPLTPEELARADTLWPNLMSSPWDPPPWPADLTHAEPLAAYAAHGTVRAPRASPRTDGKYGEPVA